MERVGLIGDNSVEYVEKIAEIWAEKKSVALIDYRIPLKQSILILKEAGVSKIYIEESLWETKYSDICIPYKVKKVNVTEIPRKLYTQIEFSHSEKEALVLFSSGTTGKSKGIKLSHRAINNNIDSIANTINLDKEDTIMVFKALSHSSTIIGEVLMGIKNQCTVILAKTTLTPRMVLENIKEFNVNYTFMNPTLLGIFNKIAADYYLPDLKAIYITGAKVSPDILKKATEVFTNAQILCGYGLTEAGPRVTMQRRDEERNLYSVGRPINNVEIAIVDYEGNKKQPGEKGIIHIKSSSLYSGYIDESRQRKSYYLDWLNSGDIGYIDKDNNLYIVGRSDNSCLVGSHVVYLEEVEEKISGYGGITDCMAVVYDDNLYGQSIWCYYTGTLVDAKDIRKYLMDILAPYEIPKKFINVSELPLTLSGKKKRIQIYDNCT